MWSFLFKIFSFFMNLWGGLSDEQKERVINMIIDAFEPIFRAFFKEKKQENKNG